VIISFSGLDGSGKSTHIRMTVDFLRRRGIRARVIEIYNMSFFSIMGRLLSLISKKHAQRLVVEQFQIEEEVSLKKRFLSLIRRVSFFLDVSVFYIFVKLPAKTIRGHIICDRYFYDTVIQLYYLGMCSKEFYEKGLKWISMPDIPIIILVEPKVAFGRKFEYDENYFSRKSIFYEDVATKKINCKVVVSKGLAETQREIEQIIIAKIDKTERAG
jgi:thymidylate kinase